MQRKSSKTANAITAIGAGLLALSGGSVSAAETADTPIRDRVAKIKQVVAQDQKLAVRLDRQFGDDEIIENRWNDGD